MALKAIVKDIAEVPEALRSEYTKAEDGSFVLNVDEASWKPKLDEMRTNNRKLFGEKEELTKLVEKFKDIDPEKYQKAMQALALLEQQEDGELLKQGKLDEVLKKRTTVMREEFEKTKTAYERNQKRLAEDADRFKSQYTDLKIKTDVLDVVNSVGVVKPGHLIDVLNRARAAFELDDDGNLKSRGLFNEKSEPMTAKEWAQSLLVNAPGLFEGGGGGGASGGKKQHGGPGPKVIDKRDVTAIGKYAQEILDGKMVVGE